MPFADSNTKDSDLKKGKAQKKHRNKVLVIVLSLFLAILIAIDISPVGGGNIELYASWVRCGKKPYKGMSTNPFSANGNPYYSRDYIPIRFIFSNLEVTRESFCTEREAELAGYSADRNDYIFPHLNEEENEIRRRRK